MLIRQRRLLIQQLMLIWLVIRVIKSMHYRIKPGVKVMSDLRRTELQRITGNKDNPLMSNPAFWGRSLVGRLRRHHQKSLKGQYFTHQSFLPVGFPGALEETPFTSRKEILAKPESKTHFTLDVENKPPTLLPSRSQFRPALLRAV